MESTRTALVVEIPEAEPVVAEHRTRLDPMAPLEVPAHVTVLFPFVPSHRLEEEMVGAVAAVAREHEPFDYRFATTGWFGDDVLFLEPEDPSPFVHLTERFCAAFPDFSPYGGAFAGHHPHLTVGQGAGIEELRAAEQAVLAFGTVVAGRATHVSLLTEQPDRRWSRAEQFPIG